MSTKRADLISLGSGLITLMLIASACGGGTPAVEPPQTDAPQASPTDAPVTAESTATPHHVADPAVLYHDDFTNPGTGWSVDKFDNYFIGYHEPEYYHVEITAPNYKTSVFEPEKRAIDDATIELQVLTNSAKTSPTGDFRYGLAFRRSGDQFYAFTISPRTKNWYVLKSSPNRLEVLAEGTDDTIHEIDIADMLRVDAQGPNLSFHINDHLVEQITDPDYTTGEVGFYVESFDSPQTHVHFDALTIRNFEAPPAPESAAAILYQDDFTNPGTGWSARNFDNYFIGYHEPEYYHVEITAPHYKTSVFEPEKRSLDEATIELEVFANSAKTSPTGDFRYGLAFRRSGDQFYAFTVSPRTKSWYILKSSPNLLEVLAEGTDDSIHDADVADVLRVDAQGPNFFFHINDRLVGQVSDADYRAGEVGFYVESFDSPQTHIHFDKLTIRSFEVSLLCEVTAVALNVRTGPATTFPSPYFLSTGDAIQPLGISRDQDWIKIKVEDGGDAWIFNSEGFVSCNAPVELLPVISP